MTGRKQPAPAVVPTSFPAAEAADIARLVEDLDGMLSRLRLGAIREQLDGLLEEAAHKQLNLREALAWLCAAEVASKEQRCLSMAMTIAHFPFVRTLEGFEFEAQPSIDPAKIRDLATCRRTIVPWWSRFFQSLLSITFNNTGCRPMEAEHMELTGFMVGRKSCKRTSDSISSTRRLASVTCMPPWSCSSSVTSVPTVPCNVSS